jgi:predicted lipid-binding transport protein (Tim44 family)
MRKALALFAIVLSLGVSSLAFDAEAKRLGGGKSSGMQRQNTTAPANAPAGGAGSQQSAPGAGVGAAAAAPAAAAAGKRSWMGPVAGLAAGLGLAALASHFGFGAALANMMMIGLLVMGVLLVIGFVMRKRMAAQGGTLAGAGPAGPFQRVQPQDNAYRTAEGPGAQNGSLIGSGIGAGSPGLAAGTQPGAIPADFDAVSFATNARTQFMALQAANDAGDLVRLRDFLTPDMFETVRADIAARGAAPQATEVFGLDARVLGVVEEDGHYVASVRFTGSTRDQHGAVPEELDEVWHLTKPRTGLGGWVIAGIQQTAAGSNPA